MDFVGYTALIDAGIVILSWIVLYMKKSKMQPPSEKVKYLSSYLLWTFVFLLLMSVAIFKTDSPQQMMSVLVFADLVLWISMVVFILMMYAGTEGKQKGFWIGLFLVFAAMRTMYQVAQVTGTDTTWLGHWADKEFFGKLDQWLMYAVWVPASVVLITVGLGSDNVIVRMRSIMFAIGLLLISATWAYRFVANADPSLHSSGYWLIGSASIAGFVLLLMGIFYKGSSSAKTS